MIFIVFLDHDGGHLTFHMQKFLQTVHFSHELV
jgi:hypothetical protein